MSNLSDLITQMPKRVTLRATETVDKNVTGQVIGRNGETVTQIIMPFNPDALSSTYQCSFESVRTVVPNDTSQGNAKQTTATQGSPSRLLNANFILDETLPTDPAQTLANTLSGSVSVIDYITALETLCTVRNADSTAPYIWMEWGETTYTGQVSNLSIQQTLFNRAGAPIQARVNLSLTNATVVAPVLEKGPKFDKPSIKVIEGSNLTALMALLGAAAITATGGGVSLVAQSSLTNTSNDYIQLAADNDLDSLNDTPTGDTLIVGS